MNLFDLDINEITEGVFIADNHGVYLHINERGANMLGFSVEELTGMSITDVIFEKDFERFQNNFQQMNQGMKIFEEYEMKHKDGVPFIVELSARKLSDKNYLGIIRDVTHKKSVERELKESQQNLLNFFNTIDDMFIVT
jgi:PAS domain S-box-containing protein